MTDDEAHAALAGIVWDQGYNERPEWVDGKLPLEGFFTREELLALLHFHPDNIDNLKVPMSFARPKSEQNPDGFCFDTLLALARRGPLEDGDVPSKTGRNDLIEHSLATRVIANGQDGYTALTYEGRDFFVRYMGCTTLAEALAKQDAKFAAQREQAR